MLRNANETRTTDSGVAGAAGGGLQERFISGSNVADANRDGTYPSADTNANACTSTNTGADANSNTDSNADSNTDANADAHTSADADTRTHADSDSDANTDARWQLRRIVDRYLRGGRGKQQRSAHDNVDDNPIGFVRHRAVQHPD